MVEGGSLVNAQLRCNVFVGCDAAFQEKLTRFDADLGISKAWQSSRKLLCHRNRLGGHCGNFSGQCRKYNLPEERMKHSPLIQNVRDEQRHEMMRKTAAERLAIALELSDTCYTLNRAARKAIEERRVPSET